MKWQFIVCSIFIFNMAQAEEDVQRDSPELSEASNQVNQS